MERTTLACIDSTWVIEWILPFFRISSLVSYLRLTKGQFEEAQKYLPKGEAWDSSSSLALKRFIWAGQLSVTGQKRLLGLKVLQYLAGWYQKLLGTNLLDLNFKMFLSWCSRC